MPDVVVADAPGRVNLIGEHTDYHQGFVLPTVIPQRTRVRLARRGDRQVVATSSMAPGGAERYEIGHETKREAWIDYVQGVTAMLARRGVTVRGFDVHIESTIPVGAGVSSSAALAVSLLRALRQLLHVELDDVELAKVAQTVETEFVGAPVGIMDQMASSLGAEGEALFLDTRTLASERVRLPASMDLVVIHSGQTHAHAGGEYVTRRRESFEAAAALGVPYLRDAGAAMLPRLAELAPALARRARHVITENARVLEAVRALRAGDIRHLGALFSASHVSMRDDYETSTPEIDALVAIGMSQPGVLGARLTGGGFGGAVVMIAEAGTGAAAARASSATFAQTTGLRPAVLMPSQL